MTVQRIAAAAGKRAHDVRRLCHAPRCLSVVSSSYDYDRVRSDAQSPSLPHTSLSPQPIATSSTVAFATSQPRRLFWSSADLAEMTTLDETPLPPLPAPPLMPSNISATSLIPHSTVESLKSLPECQYVLDLLDGSTSPGEEVISIESVQLREAHSNLQRARDILQSLPEMSHATQLLEADLLIFSGQFESALECLTRYENLTRESLTDKERTCIQFIKAKLLVYLGRLTHALSDYEYLLEDMERHVELQVQQQERQQDEPQQQQPNEEVGESLTVIHGASALSGVGLTNLFLHLRQGNTDTSESEIIDSLETAAEMLLESREEAMMSFRRDHTRLAIELGLAASISLTNLGVAHQLLAGDRDASIAQWKRGIDTLDQILRDAMVSATIIPRYKFQCMESVRARLYCNIACVLLGLDEVEGAAPEKVSEETLKEASDAAKKALDIYDELINGAKMLREDAAKDQSSTESDNEDDDSKTTEEWETIMKDKSDNEQQVDGTESEPTPASNRPPKEIPLSNMWTAYHRSESARALGLVAHCYATAGAAVTAEGLFQSALGASSSFPLGQSLTPSKDDASVGGKGVSLSSPNLGLSARDVRLWYAMLCDNWEKRKGDADRLRLDATQIEEKGVLMGVKQDTSVSGLESSIWLIDPLDFESK